MRVLKEFRIDELSAVDRPAQEGARVAIMKRAAGEPAEGSRAWLERRDEIMRKALSSFERRAREAEAVAADEALAKRRREAAAELDMLVKRGEAKGLSHAQAYAEALAERPDLYELL